MIPSDGVTGDTGKSAEGLWAHPHTYPTWPNVRVMECSSLC
jgi:hypothetical protein